MQEYRIAKVWRILVYIVGPVMIGLGGIILFGPFIFPEEVNKLSGHWIMSILSVAIIAFGILAIIDTYRRKIIITNDRLYSVTTFSAHEWLLTEINGFTIRNNVILVFSSASKNKIEINVYFSKTREIIDWLNANYPYLEQA